MINLGLNFRSSQYFLSPSSDFNSLGIKWDTLPEELRPVAQKRKSKINVKKPNLIKKKPVDVNLKLKELETKENTADKVRYEPFLKFYILVIPELGTGLSLLKTILVKGLDINQFEYILENCSAPI